MRHALTEEERLLVTVYGYETAAHIPDSDRLTFTLDGKVAAKPDVTECQIRAMAAKYSEFMGFCRQVDELAEAGAMLDRAIYASEHAVLSSSTPKIYLELGFRDRPFSITEGHLYDLFQPGPWDGGRHHSHGIPIETVKRLPWLLERPALIANHNAYPDRVLVVLPDVDSRGLPLIASLIPDATGLLDLEKFITNQVATVFGPDKFYDYFGRALLEENVILINSKQETALADKVGKTPFSHLDLLPRDVRLAEPNDYLADRGVEVENGEWIKQKIDERLRG